MGDLGWQDWSQFGSPQITINGQQSDRDNRLKDTWHTALGVQYHPDEQWRINAGIAYDSSPYKSQSDVALSMPTGDEWRLATGAQYQITPASNIGVAVEYLHMQSSNVKSGIFAGQYKTRGYGLPASTTAISSSAAIPDLIFHALLIVTMADYLSDSVW